MDPTQPQQTNQPLPPVPQPAMPQMPIPQPAVPSVTSPAPLPMQQPAPVMQPMQQPVQPVQFAANIEQPMPLQQAPMQQAPVVQPFATSQQPYTAQQPQSYSSMSADNSKKKKLIFAGIGIAVAAVLVAGILVVLGMNKISKEDYRKASTTATEAEDKLREISTATNSLIYLSNATETQVKNNVDAANKAIQEYEAADKKLSEEKAVKKGESAALYTAYKQKNDAYMPIVKNFSQSVEKVMVPLQKCTDATSSSTSGESISEFYSMIDTCVSTMSSLTDINDADMKSLAESTVQTFKDMKSLLQQIEAIPLSNYAKRSELRTKYYDVLEAYTDKENDVQSNITKKLKDNSPSDDMRKLADSLFTQSIKK